MLIRGGGTKLKNFPDTRFAYYRDTCESILKNLELLKQLCLVEDISLNPNIIENLLDDGFERTLREIVNNLNPICQLINKCQDPTLNIADGTQLWLRLELRNENYDQIISDRIKKAVWPAGYTANMLHHKYQGRLLDEEQKAIGNNFLEDYLNIDAKRELQIFLERRDMYEVYAENCDNSIGFWYILGWSLPHLSKFMVKLFLIPASTALIESYFSHWTYVHNSYRNRLGNEKSANLVDIYHSLRHNPISY